MQVGGGGFYNLTLNIKMQVKLPFSVTQGGGAGGRLFLEKFDKTVTFNIICNILQY